MGGGGNDSLEYFEECTQRWVSSCHTASNANNPNLIDLDAAQVVGKAMYSGGGKRYTLQTIVKKAGGLNAISTMANFCHQHEQNSAGYEEEDENMVKLIAKTFYLVQQMATKSTIDVRLQFLNDDDILSLAISRLKKSTKNLDLILSTLSTLIAALSDKKYADIQGRYMQNYELLLSFAEQYSGAARLVGNLAYHSPNHQVMKEKGTLKYLKRCLENSNASARVAGIFTIALLIGSQDNHPDLEMPEDCIDTILKGLTVSMTGKSMGNTFYNSKKVLLALSKLCANDKNKEKIVQRGGVDLLVAVLDQQLEKKKKSGSWDVDVVKEAIQCLWLLAYDELGRSVIQERCMDKLEELERSDNHEISMSANGCLIVVKQLIGEMTQIMIENKKQQDNDNKIRLMLSYQWDSQEMVLRIRRALAKHKIFETWIDVEQMSGNVTDAMAKAVESADIVCICPSQQYADSPACRLECEYAWGCRKKIVPLMMQQKFRPTGWLGLIMGQKLYYSFSDPEMSNKQHQETMGRLMKELKAHNQKMDTKIMTPSKVRNFDEDTLNELKAKWKQELKHELKDELKDELKEELMEELMEQLMEQLMKKKSNWWQKKSTRT